MWSNTRCQTTSTLNNRKWKWNNNNRSCSRRYNNQYFIRKSLHGMCSAIIILIASVIQLIMIRSVQSYIPTITTTTTTTTASVVNKCRRNIHRIPFRCNSRLRSCYYNDHNIINNNSYHDRQVWRLFSTSTSSTVRSCTGRGRRTFIQSRLSFQSTKVLFATTYNPSSSEFYDASMNSGDLSSYDNTMIPFESMNLMVDSDTPIGTRITDCEATYVVKKQKSVPTTTTTATNEMASISLPLSETVVPTDAVTPTNLDSTPAINSRNNINDDNAHVHGAYTVPEAEVPELESVNLIVDSDTAIDYEMMYSAKKRYPVITNSDLFSSSTSILTSEAVLFNNNSIDPSQYYVSTTTPTSDPSILDTPETESLNLMVNADTTIDYETMYATVKNKKQMPIKTNDLFSSSTSILTSEALLFNNDSIDPSQYYVSTTTPTSDLSLIEDTPESESLNLLVDSDTTIDYETMCANLKNKNRMPTTTSDLFSSSSSILSSEAFLFNNDSIDPSQNYVSTTTPTSDPSLVEDTPETESLDLMVDSDTTIDYETMCANLKSKKRVPITTNDLSSSDITTSSASTVLHQDYVNLSELSDVSTTNDQYLVETSELESQMMMVDSDTPLASTVLDSEPTYAALKSKKRKAGGTKKVSSPSITTSETMEFQDSLHPSELYSSTTKNDPPVVPTEHESVIDIQIDSEASITSNAPTNVISKKKKRKSSLSSVKKVESVLHVDSDTPEVTPITSELNSDVSIKSKPPKRKINKATKSRISRMYLPLPKKVVDSPAFLTLNYFRELVEVDPNMIDEEEEEEQESELYIVDDPFNKEHFTYTFGKKPKPKKVKPPPLPKYDVRRSFVAHPTFRYMTTNSNSHITDTSDDNIDKNKLLQQQLDDGDVVEAVVENRNTTNTVHKYDGIDEEEGEKIYNELKTVSEMIRQQDEIYYNNNYYNIYNTNKYGGRSKRRSTSSYIQLQPVVQPISDVEYDALVELEKQLCVQYPEIFERIQNESPFGNLVTRYNGRVGISPSSSLSIPSQSSSSVSSSLAFPGSFNYLNAGVETSDNEGNNSDGSSGVDDDDMNVSDEVMTVDKIKEKEEAAILAGAETDATNVPQLQRVKRTHLRPMLSLDNVNDTTQLMAWLERIRKKIYNAKLVDQVNLDDTVGDDDDDIVVTTMPITFTILTEPKLDGLSLNIRYILSDDMKTYQLQFASTRGDGKRGVDVTNAIMDGICALNDVDNNISNKNNIPYTIRIPPVVSSSSLVQYWPKMLEIRGEIVLPQSVFQQLQRNYDTFLEKDGDDPNTATSAVPYFSNARNAASGILLRKDQSKQGDGSTIDDDIRSKLRFYAYDIVVDHPDDLVSLTPVGGSVRDVLRVFGFTIPQPCISTTLTVHPNNDDNTTDIMWTESDISGILDYYNDLRAYRESKSQHGNDKKVNTVKAQLKVNKTTQYEWGDYDIDGCVHKVLDESLRTLLGNSNRAPRWAVAHKFPPTIAITELHNIEIQVGRTGALTPVAILKPIDIDGVTVQRATMHNFNHMQQVLGHPNRVINGTKVLVRRAGEVIPQVMSRVFPLTEAELLLLELDPTKCISIDLPSNCPACGSIAIGDTKDETSTTGTVLRCSGPSLLCPPRAVAALQYAYSRDAFDIAGLSDARIEQLIDTGYLHIPSDLFELVNDENKINELSKLPGWGKRSVNNLVATVQRVATDGISLSRFIYSLGIRGSGVHSSALIASVYATVDEFLKDLNEATLLQTGESNKQLTGFSRLQEENDHTKGIGPTMIAALHDFAREKVLVDATRRLADCVKVINDDSIASLSSSNLDAGKRKGPLSGLSVVFTGAISDLSRTEAHKIAKELGAKSTPASVSKSTGLVVSGDAGGKKLLQAHKLGVRVINAEEFLAMVDEYRESKE